jgi:dipeptidase E
MKAILTSTGFDNDNLVTVFHDLLGKPPVSSKALFIPTALNSPKARKYINVFLEDLYKVGIIDSNIDTYDLDEPIEHDRIQKYDIVFVCPGDPVHLIKKLNEMKFDKALEIFLKNGGVYIGVSAGSDIFALNLPGGLGYLNATIECHAKSGHTNGRLETSGFPAVKLTDNQAIVITDDNIEITE